ncbi:MAG: DUF4870 domain-containing protein [Spirochaetes bacterium]|nr:DUF4870 domain-containing protein [Spirochaetota bacterium]
MPRKAKSVTDDGVIAVPQPDDISEVEREDAMGAYLMMFASWGIGLPLPFVGLIAAFIYHMINRKKSPFVGFHSLQSLLMETPVSIANAGIVVWAVLIFTPYASLNAWFWAAVAVVSVWNIIYIIVSIIACVYARKGRFYYVMFFGRHAFRRYYLTPRRNAVSDRNEPPKGL